jgi:hypothetical protein
MTTSRICTGLGMLSFLPYALAYKQQRGWRDSTPSTIYRLRIDRLLRIQASS